MRKNSQWHLSKRSRGKYWVSLYGHYFGDFILDVDGFFYLNMFHNSNHKYNGLYSAEEIELVTKALKDLNKEWNDIINKYHEEINTNDGTTDYSGATEYNSSANSGDTYNGGPTRSCSDC